MEPYKKKKGIKEKNVGYKEVCSAKELKETKKFY